MKERRRQIQNVCLTRDLLLPLFEVNAFEALRTTLLGWLAKAKEASEK